MRRQLCDEHAAAMNQAPHLEDPMLRRLSKRNDASWPSISTRAITLVYAPTL
jgi:hypothetical protein